MTPDLEMRKPYSTRPPSMQVVSCTKRGHRFLKNWVTAEDPPFHVGNKRYAVVLVEPDVKTLWADAMRAGLELGGSDD